MGGHVLYKEENRCFLYIRPGLGNTVNGWNLSFFRVRISKGLSSFPALALYSNSQYSKFQIYHQKSIFGYVDDADGRASDWVSAQVISTRLWDRALHQTLYSASSLPESLSLFLCTPPPHTRCLGICLLSQISIFLKSKVCLIWLKTKELSSSKEL